MRVVWSLRVALLEWLTSGMMLLACLFSFLHGQYETAIVAGICAGLVAGIAFCKTIYRV